MNAADNRKAVRFVMIHAHDMCVYWLSAQGVLVSQCNIFSEP